jgi:outer membrane protein assembly factor BamB
MLRTTIACRIAFVSALTLAGSTFADWSNLGGTQGRTGLTEAIGPVDTTLRWSGAPSSIIAWNPCVEGSRIFVVRQTAFAPNGVPNESKVYALSLATGATLWSFACPYAPGDWTTNVYGVNNGRVFVGRGGNGSSVSAPVFCLDAATGNILWSSAEEVATGSYDGVTFTDDGDPIFATHLYIRRVNRNTGETVWHTPRSCSVSGDCGPAISGNAIYIDEVGSGGQVISRFDAETGAKLYSSPAMPGFTSQNTPMAGPDGRVYYARTQTNPSVDFMYAWQDTGSGFVQLWKQPAIGGAGSNHGLTHDGGIVMVGLNGRLQVRDQITGALRHESRSTVTASPNQSHVAVDGDGKIFYGNGGFPGTIFSFNSDLTLRWSVAVNNLNQGGPVLAGDGTLLVAGAGTDFRAYNGTPACADADLDCDGSVGAPDLALLLGAWGTPDADLDDDGVTGSPDLAILLGAWN